MPDPSFAAAVLWFAAQLVPSPEIASAQDGPLGGLRWQGTPVLWSFGGHRGGGPGRGVVVEPMVRHSGSVELFVSPEYLAVREATGSTADTWFLRPGVRAYFPVVQHG